MYVVFNFNIFFNVIFDWLSHIDFSFIKDVFMQIQGDKKATRSLYLANNNVWKL